mmetsp:Transcript_126310/g.369068  ORF Transcript_126310/g.369068 Transcript_126310/m.369068 type:complete len:231 (-) Transcript_126310:95-787(-)
MRDPAFSSRQTCTALPRTRPAGSTRERLRPFAEAHGSVRHRPGLRRRCGLPPGALQRPRQTAGRGRAHGALQSSGSGAAHWQARRGLRLQLPPAGRDGAPGRGAPRRRRGHARPLRQRPLLRGQGLRRRLHGPLPPDGRHSHRHWRSRAPPRTHRKPRRDRSRRGRTWRRRRPCRRPWRPGGGLDGNLRGHVVQDAEALATGGRCPHTLARPTQRCCRGRSRRHGRRRRR